jgi:hypothetical protein
VAEEVCATAESRMRTPTKRSGWAQPLNAALGQQALGRARFDAGKYLRNIVIMPPPPSLPDPTVVSSGSPCFFVSDATAPPDRPRAFSFTSQNVVSPAPKTHIAEVGPVRDWTKLSRTHFFMSFHCRPVFEDLRRPKGINKYHAFRGPQPQKNLVNIALSEARPLWRALRESANH